ncbi:MAG: pimeloyl-ACP methyl ester esterase BioH [Rhodocyclaceae bacterium]|nr:pimeloyl-ACP methyl ester esterase BioH [Rhodocyclaceae bacterium]
MSRRELVLLHGWGMHGGIWGEFGEILADECNLHRPNLPGHGGRTSVAPYSLDTLASTLLEELPRRAVLLGWSLGGMVAQRLAALAPDRVEKLILVGSSPRFCRDESWSDAMAPAVLDAFEAQMRGDAAATLHRFLAIQALGGEDARAQVSLLKRFLGERPLPTEQTLRDGLALLRHGDVRPHLSEIRQPLCLIHGEQDGVVPVAAARRLAGLFPDAELHVLAGCAHAPFLTRPAEVAAIVRGFLAP